MYSQYLITGATGNLGRVIMQKLLRRGESVRVLVMPGDKLAERFPPKIRVCYGNVEEKESLRSFFAGDLRDACLIHCAGLVTIATHAHPKLWNVNVDGTRNIMELCSEHTVGRVIYVSSVHAIPEERRGDLIRETSDFSPDQLKGHYAKSKAAATTIAMRAFQAGLNLSVVFPSGLLCPNDQGKSNISGAILSYCKGKLPFAVKGGYDFVDVRDVADGILSCADLGRPGEGYILSGHYATIKNILSYVQRMICGRRVVYLPLWLVKVFAPILERVRELQKKPLFLTPYSVYVMGSNAFFSRKKAEAELGYCPRKLTVTLKDMVTEFRQGKLVW